MTPINPVLRRGGTPIDKMTFSKSREKSSHIVQALIIVLPFVLFYWMIPFVATQSIGNDYQTVSLRYQMELLFSIKNGSFPLYVPGFALGQSSSALTLGEVFHPLPHLAAMLPGYWEGESLECNTFLRLLSLGLTHLALFAFLRRLKIGAIFAFLLSSITIYNMRMLDLFRYGASLENYTGFILLCTAVGWHFINPTKYRGPIFIIAATYLLISGGHPQMMYYGLLGSGVFLLITPFFVSTLLPEIKVDYRIAFRFWMRGVIYLVLGVLLSAAYILPFYFEFITTNAERVKQGYEWADSIKDTFLGTINNFFLPFRSDVHGAFGGSSLIIMAALLPVLRFFRKIPLAVWSSWGVSLFAFLYMQGDRTPVHYLVWEYVPFASSFRYSGRIALIMPMFLMMVLVWVIKAKPFTVRLNNRSVELTPAFLLSILALLLTIAYSFMLGIFHTLYNIEFSPFAPVTIRNIPPLSEAFLILCGLSSLLLIAFHDKHPKIAKPMGLILCFVALLQVGIALKYGTWIAPRENKPTFEQMQAEKRDKLEYRFYPGTGMYSSIVNTQLNNSFVEPFIGKIYYYAESVSGLDNAYARMLEERTPQQVFIEGLELNNVLSGSLRDIDLSKGRVELIYSSFNKLKFKVFSPAQAFFGLSYPYTGHWKASINGTETGVYRANGSAHAIEIPDGDSLIEFRYESPYFFLGVLISCLTFILTALFISLKALCGIQRITAAVFVLVLGAGIFLVWHHSLYTGNNLKTEYIWTYEPSSPTPNLAYGKKTLQSSHWRGSSGYLHSSRAVDGKRGGKTGFSTGTEDAPWWSVDLNRVEKVERIIIYEGYNDSSINQRPLNIAFSEDSRRWRTVYSVSSTANPSLPLKVLLKTPEPARYIQIQASGHSTLRLDEVEVYGPENQL